MTIRSLTLATAACTTLVLAGCASTMTDDAAAPAATSAPAAATMSAPAAKPNPMVGGAEMLPTRTIVENAANSADHTTLVAAVQAAGLAETLSGPGPFTVFAPTNTAFSRLPPGVVNQLMMPANIDRLKAILTYHVVPGRLTAADIRKLIRDSNGSATLTTVQGKPLTATDANGVLTLTDVAGNKSYVIQGDVLQSNGVIHVVNGVVLPNVGNI